jgi:hypothetical protein
MAGASPILPTEQEMDLLRRLRADKLTALLTELDEHGWKMARAVLRSLAERRAYPMNDRKQQTHGEDRR